MLKIGDLGFKKQKELKFYEQPVTAYPEINKFKLTDDIKFIIMACDGVWDCVDEQKLCEFVDEKLIKGVSTDKILYEILDSILAKTNNCII